MSKKNPRNRRTPRPCLRHPGSGRERGRESSYRGGILFIDPAKSKEMTNDMSLTTLLFGQHRKKIGALSNSQFIFFNDWQCNCIDAKRRQLLIFLANFGWPNNRPSAGHAERQSRCHNDNVTVLCLLGVPAMMAGFS